MAKALEKTRDEKGQALLETAFVIPMFIITVLLIIQFGWVMYCSSMLSYACTHAQYMIGVSEIEDAADMNTLVADKMREAAPYLGSGELVVTNAKAEVVSDAPRKRDLIENNYEDFDKYRIAFAYEKTVRVNVSADVEYHPVLFFGIQAPSTMTRHIDSSRITSETFELG